MQNTLEIMRKFQKNTQPLGQIVNTLIAPIVKNHGTMTYAVFTNWAQIIGSELAQDTKPEKFMWSKAKLDHEPSTATLCILVSNGGIALKIQHMQEQVLSRLNAQFGWKAVTAIKIKQTLVLPTASKHNLQKPIVPTEITKQVETHILPNIDVELQNSLIRLGQAILYEERNKPHYKENVL